MKMTKKAVLTVLCCSWLAAGCLDLDVVANQSAPTAEQVLSDPAELEAVVAGTWRTLWNYSENSSSVYYGVGGVGDEWTSGNTTLVQWTITEPRQPYPNDYSLDNRFLSQNPWYAIYEKIDDVNQAMKIIEQDGIKIVSGTQDNTDRARAWGYFVQGALYSIFALSYDQASISLPDTDRSKADWWHYKPYPEVAKVAIQQLEKAISIAETADPFETPAEWTSGVPVNNDLLIRLAHTYIARLMTYLPRTPEERKDVSQGGIVDWRLVLEHANKGITEDFAPTMSSSGIVSGQIRYPQTPTIMVASNRLVGPADMSGNYAEWLSKPLSERDRFLIVTHDRRITGTDELGNPDPTVDGKYFRYAETCCAANWQSYQRGHYYWYRYNGTYTTGKKVMLSVDELNLIKAEAHYRLGELQAAADLINITRVANGELPPVTIDGVPGDIDNCVPRSFDGTECGTLLDALHHERMIEGAGLNQYRTWWDRRGFGTLVKDTYTQFPVPVRELQAMGLPFYTTGGEYGSAADGILKVR